MIPHLSQSRPMSLYNNYKYALCKLLERDYRLSIFGFTVYVILARGIKGSSWETHGSMMLSATLLHWVKRRSVSHGFNS